MTNIELLQLNRNNFSLSKSYSIRKKYLAIIRWKRCVSSIRIPLCPPELKSLYFERNAEIQVFLLPTENSFNCKNAVACEKKTGVFHTNSHEIHTT